MVSVLLFFEPLLPPSFKNSSAIQSSPSCRYDFACSLYSAFEMELSPDEFVHCQSQPAINDTIGALHVAQPEK